jgi:hypothetical protein
VAVVIWTFLVLPAILGALLDRYAPPIRK